MHEFENHNKHRGGNFMASKSTFKKDDVIFKEGEWQMSMYSVISGKVGIYSQYGKENEQLLTELEKGKLFGEMGLIEARPRSATAVALEDTEVEIIDSENLSEYFKNEPEKVVAVLINMTSRLRDLSKDYVDVCATISDYVKAEKQNKKGLWEKIKDLMTGGDGYAEMYSSALEMGFDPMRVHYEWY